MMLHPRVEELDVAFLCLVVAPLLALVPVLRVAAAAQLPVVTSRGQIWMNLLLFTLGLIIAPVGGFVLAIRNRWYRPGLILGSGGILVAIFALVGNLGWLRILPPTMANLVMLAGGVLFAVYIPTAIVCGILWLVKRARIARSGGHLDMNAGGSRLRDG